MTALRIFVADDSQSQAELTVRQLRHAGHEVVETCHDCIGITNRAVALASAGRLDLVLIDINWPGIPDYGVRVARMCKERMPGVWIVLCSAKSNDELRRAATEAGADGWISKSQLDRIGLEISQVIRTRPRDGNNHRS